MSIAVSFVRQGKKIVAIGRNYADHIKELKNATPAEPIMFLKPTSSYLPSGGRIEIPSGVIAHHEVELGVIIGRTGRDITRTNAESYIGGYALAIDVTARNLQEEVKKRGWPWTAAKGFDTFTPIGSFIPKSSIPDPGNLILSLKIGGVTKQHGSTAHMLYPIPRLIEHISSIMTLEEGDLILTGTPAGVGPIKSGDEIECALTDPSEGGGRELATLRVSAVDRQGGYMFSPMLET